jgi:hypothetical protein
MTDRIEILAGLTLAALTDFDALEFPGDAGSR